MQPAWCHAVECLAGAALQGAPQRLATLRTVAPVPEVLICWRLYGVQSRLADLATGPGVPHTVDGIVLTKMDAIDDKVRAEKAAGFPCCHASTMQA
jgi:hypothetical protein